MERHKTGIAKIMVMILAFAVAFTGLPAANGSLDAHAASYFKKLDASATGTAVSLNWNKLSKKQRKSIQGIAVFRDGKAVAHLGKKADAYTDAGLAKGTAYTYQIKTYKKKVKKVKVWKNKQTGQIKKKAPSGKQKKQWKKITSRKVSYKYSNASSGRRIKTKGNRYEIDLSAARQDMLAQINALRAEKGVEPLQFLDAINETAQQKAEDMAANNYFDHISPTLGDPATQMRNHNIDAWIMGENIATGDSVSLVMQLWIASPMHYANMIDGDYTHIGIGYKDGYWVQQFAGIRQQQDTDEEPVP